VSISYWWQKTLALCPDRTKGALLREIFPINYMVFFFSSPIFHKHI